MQPAHAMQCSMCAALRHVATHRPLHAGSPVKPVIVSGSLQGTVT